MKRVGGREDIPGAQNDVKLEDLAKYAVDQHNSQQNSDLQFVRLVSAQQQVVAGVMYYLVLEAVSGGETKSYEAKVWVKPWEHFQSLQDFKEIGSSATQPDLVTNLDPSATSNKGEVGWQAVAFNDPVVKEAAEEVLKGLQQRSNSLIPYELKKVLSARAEVTDDSTHFDLLFKVLRGSKEEQFKAEVSRTVLGAWTIKDIRLHQ